MFNVMVDAKAQSAKLCAMELGQEVGPAGVCVCVCVLMKVCFYEKAKLSIYRSIYVPTLTYRHKLWVVTERMRSRIQAAKMSFLLRVAGLSLRDRVRSSALEIG